MKYGINLELISEYKRFSFKSNIFEHNETGLSRKTVLDYLGDKLKSYEQLTKNTRFLNGVNKDFNELFRIFYKRKIGPNEPDRQKFIKEFQDIIDDITIKILSNPHNINDDFDFDELDTLEKLTSVKPQNLGDVFSGDFDFESDSSFDNEDIPILDDFVDDKTTNEEASKIDDFDDFNFDELDENPAPPSSGDDEIVKTDDFDFSEFDETPTKTSEEPAKNRKSFYFKNNEFSLFISFDTMSFKASGHDSYTINALNRFATLLFVNQELITSVSHPEWLYSGLENGLDNIFDRITSLFKFKTKDEIAMTEQYMFTQLYVVLSEYKDLVAYYTKHKDPFNLKHN
ncbi:hypothetical protein IGB31_00120 [Pseudomonas putida]|nr:hypothetical protein IGB31_00120 [Pseudomonas putida]